MTPAFLSSAAMRRVENPGRSITNVLPGRLDGRQQSPGEPSCKREHRDQNEPENLAHDGTV